MAKISLDKVFKRQKSYRILTILAFLSVGIVFGQMVINGPQKSKSYTSTATSCVIGDIDYIPAECEGKDIIISGATVYADKVKLDSNGNECSSDVGLVGYWPMDEVQGDYIYDEAEPASDTEAWSSVIVNGKYANARNFGNSGVAISSDRKFGPNDFFTIATWIKVDSNNPNFDGLGTSNDENQVIVGRGYEYGSTTSSGYMLELVGNKIALKVNTEEKVTGPFEVVVQSAAIQSNVWYFVVATFDASTGATLRIDSTTGNTLGGSKVSANGGAKQGPVIYNRDYDFAIGGIGARQRSGSFRGAIDDTRFLNYIPTDAKLVEFKVQTPIAAGCDSLRHFESMTINNGGKLTHSRVTPRDVGEDVNSSIAAESWKKIDIVLDSDLILQSGGKIDVDYKGYPGGLDQVSTYGDGYGPGGGHGTIGGSDGGGGHREAADGANHAGLGGLAGKSGSADLPGALRRRNSTTYDYALDVFNFDFGSGGGSASDDEFIRGGVGGGRVRIASNHGVLQIDNQLDQRGDIIGSESYISANGKAMTYFEGACEGCGNDGAMSGSGAGGSIALYFDQLIINHNGAKVASYNNESKFNADATGGMVDFDNDSKDIYIENGFISSIFLVNEHIYAKGGDNHDIIDDYDVYGGAGGGGAIIVGKTNMSGITIQKTLTAINRPGLSPSNNFNPYALHSNDRIQVNITLANIGGTTINFSDVYLSTPDHSKYCRSVGNVSVAAANYDIATDPWKISFIDVPVVGGNASVSYQCTVN